MEEGGGRGACWVAGLMCVCVAVVGASMGWGQAWWGLSAFPATGHWSSGGVDPPLPLLAWLPVPLGRCWHSILTRSCCAWAA